MTKESLAIAMKAKEKLEQVIYDERFTKHPVDLAVLACIIWFDLLSDRIASGPVLYEYLKPIIYSRITPRFEAKRVSSWLVEEFGYDVEFAKQRVSERETYNDRYVRNGRAVKGRNDRE